MRRTLASVGTVALILALSCTANADTFFEDFNGIEPALLNTDVLEYGAVSFQLRDTPESFYISPAVGEPTPPEIFWTPVPGRDGTRALAYISYHSAAPGMGVVVDGVATQLSLDVHTLSDHQDVRVCSYLDGDLISDAYYPIAERITLAGEGFDEVWLGGYFIPGDQMYFSIDNVSITYVPEPSGALLASAALLVLIRRRR